MQLFKVLDKNNRTYRGYRHDTAAELPELANIKLCERGYHACLDPTKWRGGIPYADVRVWLVELDGEVRADKDKVVASRMRWVRELNETWPYLPAFSALRALFAAKWRAENPDSGWPIWADLSGAILSWADLSGANLSWANLGRADLSWVNLSGADLSGAILSGADLSRANLSGADLSRANLSGADLSGAILSGADLSRANLSRADLSRADLYRADLSRAERREVDLPVLGWKLVDGRLEKS